MQIGDRVITPDGYRGKVTCVNDVLAWVKRDGEYWETPYELHTVTEGSM